jgi:lipid-binding SYLF domain-containing protein
MTIKSFGLPLALAFLCTLLSAPLAAQDKSREDYRKEVAKGVQDTIARFRKADPAIEKFFKDSAGYVVFPRVGKVGFIFAGGHGEGEVYEKGRLAGVASLTILTVGLQAGIQDFSEIIFFENQAALDRFKQNKFEFTAGVSAVALTAGAAKGANYRDGVAVFTQTTAGAMLEVALGTQKFSFSTEGGAAKK